MEPLGPVQAYNGIVLPLPLPVNKVTILFIKKERILVTTIKLRKRSTIYYDCESYIFRILRHDTHTLYSM
jgi:hypothetical protein